MIVSCNVESCVGDFGSNIVSDFSFEDFCGLGNKDKQQRLCDVFSDTSFRPYFAGASPSSRDSALRFP